MTVTVPGPFLDTAAPSPAEMTRALSRGLDTLEQSQRALKSMFEWPQWLLQFSDFIANLDMQMVSREDLARLDHLVSLILDWVGSDIERQELPGVAAARDLRTRMYLLTLRLTLGPLTRH